MPTPAADPKRLAEAVRLVNQEGLSIRKAAAKTGLGFGTIQRRVAATGATGATGATTPEMELPANELPIFFRDYSHLDKLHVFPLGDVHKGSANYQADRWQEWLGYVQENDHVSMLGTGDFLNVAIKDSVSDVYTETQTVGDAKWELSDELEPIAEAGRLDLLIPGNHEGRITRAIGDCPIRDVAKALKVNYAPVSALIVYHVGEVEYEVAIRHGSGSGRAGAQATRMERESQTVIADVYVTGHTHRQQVLRGAVFQREDARIVRRRQLYVSSGSFLSYEDYAARSGLSPADVGCPRIRLDGTRKDAHASI